ncbi:MAG TPA: hypothetical protein PKX20_09680, partial [Methanothrix soehngenii]|nr:hypothetical protein [Methanothrix soehngenii]
KSLGNPRHRRHLITRPLIHDPHALGGRALRPHLIGWHVPAPPWPRGALPPCSSCRRSTWLSPPEVIRACSLTGHNSGRGRDKWMRRGRGGNDGIGAKGLPLLELADCGGLGWASGVRLPWWGAPRGW